jgi:ABC-2 type transport system ATP-binding protein
VRPAVKLKGVSKSYRIYPRQRDRLKEVLTLGRIRHGRDFWALKDVNLEVEPGTTLGMLGRNGAGKSTLLRMISGVLPPTRGDVEVNGQVVMLQLGAGIDPEFTGRENVMLNGMILGMERKKIMERFDEIEAFADIGEFMDQPVKTYSSGMRARLGFAVAVNVEPDILIVDETLSVGDAVFKHMCLQKMRELRDSGTTILFVSHSMGTVKDFCSRAVLLHKGRLIHEGDTAETIDRYEALLTQMRAKRNAELLNSEQSSYDIDEEGEAATGLVFKESPELGRRAPSLRHGTGEARITHVEVLDERGLPVETVTPDATVTVRIYAEYLEDVPDSLVHLTLRTKTGLDVFSTNSDLEGARIGAKVKGERVIADFTLGVPLKQGLYSVTAAISYAQSKKLYLDWLDVAAVFIISRPKNHRPIQGLVHIPTTVEIHDPDRRQDRTA